MDIRQSLSLLADGRDLSLDEMKDVMSQIMSGEATDAQIGAFLIGMRLKGETLDEITAAVMVMREMATGVAISGDHLVDIVGTGGDGHNTINVSTIASLVAASCGVPIAKHGNVVIVGNIYLDRGVISRLILFQPAVVCRVVPVSKGVRVNVAGVGTGTQRSLFDDYCGICSIPR